MDKLDSLHAFTRVVELSGFAAAGRAMGRSRSVVNRQVIELEQSLGVQLLIRSTRRVSPTEAGLTFYQHALTVLDALDDAEQAVSDLQNKVTGNIRINAPMSFGQRHLAEPIARFMAEHPDLHVELVLNDRQIDPIEEGFDLTVRIAGSRTADSPSSTSLMATILTSSNRLICASPDYLRAAGRPEHPSELQTHRCLHYGYQASGNLWKLSGPGGARSWRVNCVLWSNNGEALKTACLGHQGIVLLPSFVVGDALQNGELVTVLPEFSAEPVTISALCPRHPHLAKKVRLLLAALETHFAGRPIWDLLD